MTSRKSDVVVVGTPFGAGHILLQADPATPARAQPRALVVMGHGASGDPEAPDILAVRDALAATGCLVAR
ncbi:MAG: hypothetical protein JWM93_1606, partial [Frankiales bacterium]|nr:hypothetical protein [Frankiales bacterium]